MRKEIRTVYFCPEGCQCHLKSSLDNLPDYCSPIKAQYTVYIAEGKWHEKECASLEVALATEKSKRFRQEEDEYEEAYECFNDDLEDWKEEEASA